VARRPEEASRDKDPDAAGIERFFSLKGVVSYRSLSPHKLRTLQRRSAGCPEDQKRHQGRRSLYAEPERVSG